MTRRPTSVELLEAAREHLALVAPTLGDPRLKFQTLVAAHVIGVVSRELVAEALDPGAGERDQTALAALPGHPLTDGDLCTLIREGCFDDPSALAALLPFLHTRVETD